MIAVQAALAGALIGGLYALMAAGLSVTWGVLRVINLAHFGLILVGAYLTYQLTTAWGIDPLATFVVTAPLLFVAGAALQWVYDRLNIVEFNSLLVSFGLLMIAIQVATNVWTADFRRMPALQNAYATSSLKLGALILPTTTLLAFAFAMLIVGGGHLVLRRTFLGRGMRAFAQDRIVAAAFGIDHRRLGLLLGGIAGASAAIAGMVFALGNSLTPATAYEWFGTVFAVVILGGVGNLLGTLLAGVGVGVLSGLVSVVWSPSTEPFALFLAIILALLLRPQGLFSRGGLT
ncbi:MAG TPA: branched-chain amino acid ABC transporter permease [Candidatus Limnocylindria bacterium]|nr:branched-chain amino acid ABC transporter permease [Candidatus Limnocylindria bacterium]